ncbi:hypothetical protein [Acidovorax sp. SUPP3334]|uniref:hypothetical protein n=1 Tax=Acidovorax sp. SUPP3334 TaxID=2920881 RepID=UPI0023DE1A22|nr:hypothetical protein [Acidovorax sp. SUPP3334]GKT25750.1 hypothetical protein AVHM3334_18945 [Acidovorax sp. SUPP3334]
MRLDFVTLLAITATNLFMLSAALPLIMGRQAGPAARWVRASLLLHAGQGAVQRFDQRLRKRLQAESAAMLGFAIDYSAGAALWRGKEEKNLAALMALMARADAALYAAKEQGRRQLAMG